MCRSFPQKHILILPLLFAAIMLNALGADEKPGASSSIENNVAKLTNISLPHQHTQTLWDPMPTVDFSTLSADSIKDWLMDRPVGTGNEYDIDYYIGHFHQLSNAVVTSGHDKSIPITIIK